MSLRGWIYLSAKARRPAPGGKIYGGTQAGTTQVHGDGGVEAHVKTMSLEAARFIQVWGGSCGL